MVDELSQPSGLPGLAQADAATIFDEAADVATLAAFATRRGKVAFDEDSLILESGELTTEHVEAARQHLATGATLGVRQSPLKALRHTHHRLAQLLATGVDEGVAAKLCNYDVSRVGILKSDPAFAELLSYYSDRVTQEWADFVSSAANLSLDSLQEIQRRLDENPDEFSVASLMELTKMLADRTGHAPVTKSVSVNVNADIGSRLAEARRKAAQLAQGLASAD